MSDPVVYFAQCFASANGADMGTIKVGCTRNVGGRMNWLKSGEPFEGKIIATCPGEFFEEAALHSWLKADCLRGEYYHDRGEVRRLADLTAATGRMPLPITRAEICHTWITMAQAEDFLRRHGLERDEVISLSGMYPATFDARIKQRVPSRSFVADLITAALRKGHSVDFERDFLGYSEAKARAA